MPPWLRLPAVRPLCLRPRERERQAGRGRVFVSIALATATEAFLVYTYKCIKKHTSLFQIISKSLLASYLYIVWERICPNKLRRSWRVGCLRLPPGLSKERRDRKIKFFKINKMMRRFVRPCRHKIFNKTVAGSTTVPEAGRGLNSSNYSNLFLKKLTTKVKKE